VIDGGHGGARSWKVVELNGVRYRSPSRSVVVVCIVTVVQGGAPSVTCPNNMSIATGVPQSVHGISGNF
jgi:predicted AlkP superfamily pyrophosphatase or phosphodiesterase